VAAREYESISTQPVLVARIAPHDFLEQKVCERSEAHGGAWMPISDLLNCIRREDACGVDGLVVDGIPLECCHLNLTLLKR
jgi:hypothetical protein